MTGNEQIAAGVVLALLEAYHFNTIRDIRASVREVREDLRSINQFLLEGRS